ncbi:hypothetical protein NIES2100_28080 [Calothrix sp. NIES-2100]|uniref:hypothetical protein n=1 Tax=Calothrix sp. NIES-2100 TaxID=1954172 RepID=UPI000B600318|nr:hypothetical protein NIES2100_28080 [Calothrix sp. NIES-2100]
MSNYLFHDSKSLAQQAEELGKKAVNLGLIPSFSVHHYSDSPEFYLPDEQTPTSLTAPEAYMKFKKLVEASSSNG